MPQTDLTFAVPKGRILDEALPVMARAGVVPEDGFHDKANRSLSFATTRTDMRIIRVRAFDVATFVAHGAAQVGIVGSDVIEEFDYSDLYAPVDLDIGQCRLSVARRADDPGDSGATHLRVDETRLAVDASLAAAGETETAASRLWGAAVGADWQVRLAPRTTLTARVALRWAEGTRSTWVTVDDGSGGARARLSDRTDRAMWGGEVGVRWAAWQGLSVEGGWRLRDWEYDNGLGSFERPPTREGG